MALGAELLADHDYAIAGNPGVRRTLALPAALADRVDLDALELEPGGAVVFSLDLGATLDGLYVHAGDAVRWDGSGYARVFEAAAAGVPAGVNLDAIARIGTRLVFSFDRRFEAPGLPPIRPADLVAWDAELGYFVSVLDAGPAGLDLPAQADVVAATREGGDWLLVFASAGHLGPQSWRAGEALRLVTHDGAATAVQPSVLVKPGWPMGARVDALATAALLGDGFEAPAAPGR